LTEHSTAAVKTVIVDATELIGNPIQTGIQRVVRELLRCWPAPAAEPGRDEPLMRLARFDTASGLVPVPDAVLPLLTGTDPAQRDVPFELVRDAVAAQLANACAPLPAGAPIFVPELFFDPQRCGFYRDRLSRDPGSAAFLLYDFIPWLHPALIGVTETAPLMPYLALVRDASRTAFISGRTRDDYARRILRGRKQPEEAGPILALGGNGLGLERQDFAPARRLFVALGSVDGRKNQDRIVAAFRLLWQAGGFDFDLALVGRVFAHVDRRFLDAASAELPRFRHIADASDGEVRTLLRQARATVYASEVEGFGLPPLESLQAGIPVVAVEGLPSLSDLPPHGQIRIAAADPAAIADAVRRLADDAVTEALWRDASRLHLSSWRDFGAAAATWAAGS
jgi:glycosyltransferase involved in cell wall biosynthesis